MKRPIYAWLLLVLLQPLAQADDREPVVIAVFSAYQSDVINNKIGAFVEGIATAVQRPTHVITFAGVDGLHQLVSTQQYLVLFLPRNLIAAEAAAMIPLAQTQVPLALYARPGDKALTDLRRISMPRAVASAGFAAELARVNPAIELVEQDIGTGQLRSLVSGAVDGAIMSVGLYANLAQPLRSRYVPRYVFTTRQLIVAVASPAFTATEIARLQKFLLTTSADVLVQLHQTFGISGFQALPANLFPARAPDR